MTIGADFSVAANGDIRHVSGTSRYTVLELHRWLESLVDDQQASGDDLLDITSTTPSARATDNIITLNAPYNIDDTAAEYLYDGSIEQKGGDELYSGLVVVGAVAGATTLQVVQNFALYRGDAPFWGTGINADASLNILCRMLIKTRTLSGSPATAGDIDGKRILVYAREWGHTFAEFSVLMGLGNATAAIFTTNDLNNATAVGTVAGWTTIANTEGYQTIDLGNGNGARPYFSQWDRDIYTINQLYERAKWLTRRGTSSTLYGVDGELFRGITHEWGYDGETGAGSWTQNEELSWGSGATAGKGILIAVNDLGATGTMWIQLKSGVAPSDNVVVTGGSSAKTAAVNGAVTTRSVSPCFLGQSTGAAIIGAFGIGVQSADLTTNDKLFDLTDTLQQPPNNQQFIVYGLVAGEDRVLVTNAEAGGIDYNQFLLGTGLTGATETQVDVGVGNIPADTPQTGTLRIQLNSGIYRKVDYTAHDGSRYFTIPSTDFTGGNNASVGKNVFLAYIDKLATSTQESVTLKYNASRTMFVRVRDGGTAGDNKPIKTFETTSTFGTGGGSAMAIRTSDS